ncbi:MAG TPA: transporter substrate-binding domain-containing protein [bacterium]|nr:transporter substrate-binding domain-containing protein [bacterium]
MKKIFFILSGFIIFFTANFLNARNLQEILAAKKLRVGMSDDYNNYLKNDSGEIIAGFNYDLIKKFADYLEVELEIVFIDNFSKYFSKDIGGNIVDKNDIYIPYIFENNEIDIAVDFITKNEWRDRLLDFVKIIDNRQILYTNSKKKIIKKIEELDGKRFILWENTSYQDTFEKYLLPRLKDIEYKYENANEEHFIKKINDNEADYSIVDTITFIYFKKKYPNIENCLAVSDIEELCWALSKENASLKNELEKFLKNLRKSNKFDTIFKKYYIMSEQGYNQILK